MKGSGKREPYSIFREGARCKERGNDVVWANEVERLLGKMIALLDDDGTVRPVDQGGFVFTREEWEEIRWKVDNFYAQCTDDNIEEYNRRVREKDFPPRATGKPEKPQKRQGYVYLLHHDGLYKIGRSKDVPSRRRRIGVQMPHEVTVIHSIQSNDSVRLEEQLHDMYANKRMNGEWFALSAEDVREIKAKRGQSGRYAE